MRKEPANYEQLSWMLHKATLQAERTGKKYDQAISALTAIVSDLKARYPERWNSLLAKEKAKEDTIARVNAEYLAKQKAKEAKDGLA